MLDITDLDWSFRERCCITLSTLSQMNEINSPQEDLDNFYVVAREAGAEHSGIPTWASRSDNPAGLDIDPDSGRIIRVQVEGVPGAYQLLNVLSQEECQRFVSITETLGYLEDAAVSLPRSVRHNHSTTWVTDEKTDGVIWSRIANFANQHVTNIHGADGHRGNPISDWFGGKQAVGLNARFRFYRYEKGDFFRPHTDGSWPGSRVINGKLVACAYPDRWSQMTVLLFLTEDFEGGETQFMVDSENGMTGGASNVESPLPVHVRTPMGGALCVEVQTKSDTVLNQSERSEG
ncbi:MAG: oxidoreductase [Gammaproteobacteria bacterium]|nr:oxidoreductase [Gammaproteobacteria bacterium]